MKLPVIITILLVILVATVAAIPLSIISNPICPVLWSSGDSSQLESIVMSSNGSLIAAGYETQVLKTGPSGPYVDLSPLMRAFGQAGKTLWQFTDVNGSRPAQVSLSDDGSLLTFGGADAGLLFNAAGNNSLREYRPLGVGYMFDALSGDGRYLAADTYGTIGHVLYLFRTDSNLPLWFYKFPTIQDSTIGGGLTISYEGGYVSDVGSDGKLYMFSQHDNQTLWTRSIQVTSWNAQMSRDGDRLAFGQLGTINVMGKQDNRTLRSFSFPTIFHSMALSKDGSTLAVVWGPDTGGKGQVSAYDLSTGQELFRDSPVLRDSRGNEEGVDQVGVSADGGVIAVGLNGAHSLFTGLEVYNRRGGKICTTAQWGPGRLAVSDDGHYIAGGGPISLAQTSPLQAQALISVETGLLIAGAAATTVGLVHVLVRNRQKRVIENAAKIEPLPSSTE